jgi:LytS/YehU family sensor histidine kinase
MFELLITMLERLGIIVTIAFILEIPFLQKHDVSGQA